MQLRQAGYSLWTTQPWYGSRRRRTRPGPPDLAALRKELYLALARGHS
jgi:hypothetical protein